MTELEQRTMIAEWMGWQKINRPGAISGWDNFQWQLGNDVSTLGKLPPDYTNDLNAIHEAELKLRDEGIRGERMAFNQYLDDLRDYHGDYAMVTTAKQRSEALSRLLRMWMTPNQEYERAMDQSAKGPV